MARVIGAMRGAEIQEAIDSVKAYGAEVVHVFRTLPFVQVKVGEGALPLLMKSSVVDVVVPDVPLETHGLVSRPSPLPLALTSSAMGMAESIDWGPIKVHAPDVWNTGSGTTGDNSPTYTDEILPGEKSWLRVTVISVGRSAAATKLIGGFATC